MAFFLRRVFARFIDYLLWGMLTVAVLGEKAGELTAPSVWFYLSFCLWVFVESVLVSSFGTTAGKRLTGIRIFNENGEKLSKTRSFKRAFLVFAMGMGFFAPYVSLAAPFIAAVWFFKYGTFPWDKAVSGKVEPVKTTPADKIVLACFVLFFGFGYFMTVRIAYLYREPDFAGLEEKILSPYYESIRPQLVRVLSQEAPLTPESADNAVKALRDIQGRMQYQKDEVLLIKDAVLQRFDKMPEGEWKQLRQEQVDDFFDKADNFLFVESMRIGLFENILDFFKSAEKNKYELIDGQPVFADEELNRQYDNYMVQLQNFLLSDAQEAD